MSLWELIKTGGWVMIPLFVCSVAVWAVVFERLWTLKKWKEKNRDFLLSFSNHWLKGDFEAALKTCQRSDSSLAEIADALLENLPSGSVLKTEQQRISDVQIRKLERKRLEVSSDLKKFLWVLGTIGSAAPFIGLFGTVVGIIKSFMSMAESGSGGFAVVAAGISEALVATAAGILVAVIAVFFYNYLQVKVSSLQFQLKLFTEELVEVFQHQESGVR